MSGQAIGVSLALGYPGKISRLNDVTIESMMVKSNVSGQVEGQKNIPFGMGVVINDDNTVSLVGDTGAGVSAPTAATFAGVASAGVKQAVTYGTNQSGAYVPGQACSVIVKGTVSVICTNGSPKANGPVYLRITPNGAFPNAPVGGFEAVADGANSVLLTNCKWRSDKKDSDNVTELKILSRNV